MVQATKLMAELYSCHSEGRGPWYSIVGASEYCWACLPWARRSCRQVLLHVHVSFFVTACEVATRRFCYGGAPPIKCSAYPTASEQLGVSAGLPCPLSVVVFAAFSPYVFILLWHKATTTDNMAIFSEQAEYKQTGCIYWIVQTLQGWVFQSGGEGGREVVFLQRKWEY